LCASPNFADTAVIVNEFGEIGLDHALVEAGDEDTLLLGGGCLCCTFTAELPKRLRSLLERRDQRKLPPYRRVIIETSGLADPIPILQSLMTDPLRLSRYKFAGLTTVVDGQLGAATLEQHREARHQAAAADCIIVSKMDLVREDYSAFNAIAKHAIAPVFTSESVDMLSDVLFSTWRQSINDLAAAQKEIMHDYVSAGDVINQDLTIDEVERWIAHLLSAFGDRLLRLKAIVPIVGEERPVVVHAVQHIVHPLEFLRKWPDSKRQGAVVLIARRLPQQDLAVALSRLKRN
jgi:G3E family GTPase